MHMATRLSTETQTYKGLTHEQPHPTGSLLRKNPDEHSEWVSQIPIPNHVNVEPHESSGNFTRITFDLQTGWVRTKYLKPSFSPSIPFKLTTYNILTGGSPWLGISPYERETTSYQFSAWDNRKHLVVAALQDSEIVMLNEATDAQLSHIEEQLKLTTVSRALKPGEYDGSAILVDQTKWHMLDTFQSQIFKNATQVVVAVHLQNIESHKHLYLVSLHLKSGYADREQQRCKQFEKAMRMVFERFPDSHNTPLVVAGDLNSDYQADFAVLIRKMLPEKFPMLRNAAADANGIGVDRPTYYFWHKSVFDYILISKHMNLEYMETEDAHEKAPNKTQGSDHFPVSAVVRIL